VNTGKPSTTQVHKKMKNLKFVLVISVVFAASGFVNADTHYEEVWDCKLVEGKTIKQVNAINAKWMKFVNKNVKGGGISSRSVTPVVGSLPVFIFVDSYPSLQSWADAKNLMEGKEGQALDAEFSTVSECTSNSLYKSTT
jgi:hypothetical protein